MMADWVESSEKVKFARGTIESFDWDTYTPTAGQFLIFTDLSESSEYSSTNMYLDLGPMPEYPDEPLLLPIAQQQFEPEIASTDYPGVVTIGNYLNYNYSNGVLSGKPWMYKYKYSDLTNSYVEIGYNIPLQQPTQYTHNINCITRKCTVTKIDNNTLLHTLGGVYYIEVSVRVKYEDGTYHWASSINTDTYNRYKDDISIVVPRNLMTYNAGINGRIPLMNNAIFLCVKGDILDQVNLHGNAYLEGYCKIYSYASNVPEKTIIFDDTMPRLLGEESRYVSAGPLGRNEACLICLSDFHSSESKFWNWLPEYYSGCTCTNEITNPTSTRDYIYADVPTRQSQLPYMISRVIFPKFGGGWYQEFEGAGFPKICIPGKLYGDLECNIFCDKTFADAAVEARINYNLWGYQKTAQVNANLPNSLDSEYYYLTEYKYFDDTNIYPDDAITQYTGNPMLYHKYKSNDWYIKGREDEHQILGFPGNIYWTRIL